MSAKKLMEAIEAELRVQERATGSWRDPNTHQLYGIGPDAAKKWVALLEVAACYGYRPEHVDDYGLTLEFDPRLAQERDIPTACWPESATSEEPPVKNPCECCDEDPCVHADEIPDGYGAP